MHCNGAVLGQKTGQLPATLGNCYPDKLAMLYLSKCLAVVNAVHYFRVHLATGQFTIKTNHRSEIFFGPSKLSKWKFGSLGNSTPTIGLCNQTLGWNI